MGAEENASKVVPAFLGGFICIYGLVSGFIKERLFLSESLVATAFGIAIGPKAIGLVDPHKWTNVEKFTLEFARYVIGIQVMAAGATLPRRYMVRKWRSMSMLLGPVMVAMWLVTAAFIKLMFDIDFKQALLIGSCAAPTDPILANSVVKGRYAESNVPKNVRDALSAESGVNDGLGLPFMFLALYLLDETFTARHAVARWFYWTWCYQILLSVVIGITVGYIARKLLRLSEAYDLIDKESFLGFTIGLSIFLLGCLQLIGSDDVLACFIAGHSFTWDDWFREETKDAHFQEVLDSLINVAFFIYFGTIIPWDQFNQPDLMITPWRLVVCAIAVLCLRRIPVVILLTRFIPALRNYRQSIFAGWFGPIGVGAIFFAETVLEEIEKKPDAFHIRSREIIQPVIIFLILSSVLVHGITLPLLYIGKVVRSRSRSFSTLSLRSGIASRFSFAGSRQANDGIHGVHLPNIGSHMSIVDEFKPPVPDSQESPGTTSAYFDGTDNTKTEDDEPAAPLDLTRTITIDDTPRVDRNQMDIHYRLADINRQSQSQVPPTLLSGPQYSHLTADSSTQRPRWYSSADISDRSPESEEEVASSGHSVVRVKTKHHEYYAGPDRDDEVAHEAPAVPDHKLPAVAIDKTRSQEQEETGDSQESSPVDDSDDGLVLAADKIIASRQASKQDAERPRTIMSNPEPPERVYLGIGPSGNSPPTSVHSGNTHHSTTPAAQAAHHGTALGISDYHGVDIDARSERSSLPTHTHRRRHRRMRRISDPVTGESQMCEFVGNRRNPVGKTEQGELVDYDDPADEGAEESFRDNNVEDNFIDYLRPRFGTRLRRLRDAAANSAASTSRRQH